MPLQKTLLIGSLALAVNAQASAGGAHDRIHANGFEPGLAIIGKAFWPEPLAGGHIVARVDQRTFSSVAMSDGSFSLWLNHPPSGTSSPILLEVAGQNQQAHISWRSQLGTFEQLLATAGSDRTLTFDEEPFVHLTPRSTAITAFVWAYNDHTPPESQAELERAYQATQAHVGDTTLALALLAQGDLPLAHGVHSTWDAVADLPATQRLYADYQAYRMSVTCYAWSLDPLCVLEATLPVDPSIFPAVEPGPEEKHSVSRGFEYIGGFLTESFIINGENGLFQHARDTIGFRPAVVSNGPDGTYILSRPDGSPLAAELVPASINGFPAMRLDETVDAHVRVSRGLGNKREVTIARTMRVSWASHPHLPPVITPARLSLPHPSHSNPLPTAQQSQVPDLRHRRWVMTTPFDDTSGNALIYQRSADIHPFDWTGGSTERGAQAFSLLAQTPDGYVMTYGQLQAQVQLINQDQDGVWRTLTRFSGTDRDMVVAGLLFEVDEPAPTWTMSNIPGTYRSRINAFNCDGPYAEIQALSPIRDCGPPYPTFHLNSDGTGTALLYEVPSTLTWWLDQGRLRLHRFAQGTGTLVNARAWEILKVTGDRIWIMENSNTLPHANDDPALLPSARVYSIERHPIR